MKNRPLPVIIVSILFILAGCIGFAYHLHELFAIDNNLIEAIWILFLRILAIIFGLCLLRKLNRAQWFTIGWLLYHVIISAFNSTSEMIIHITFLILVSILLFLPASSKYFQNKTNDKMI
jgi:hypothetical protein